MTARFGRRAAANDSSAALEARIAAAPPPAPTPSPPASVQPIAAAALTGDPAYAMKTGIFAALLETLDLAELGKMDQSAGRQTIRDIVIEIIAIQGLVLSAAEQDRIVEELLNDILGLGPLEPLLARDDIADIMVNGFDQIYIEVNGLIERVPIQFRDNAQLMNVCQRIVSSVGRRVDEASPICDARLADGSRVNVIVPPLALHGPVLTIRKFKRDKLTLDQLVGRGAVTPEGAQILKIAAACRTNILVSGGTGSGKTTLLNCLTRFISPRERIVTCEDAAELQLQQPHVVSLETRPANLEGRGEIVMRDLVKNCLRMRPDRIIVGEVRGAEAFDLLQAMNTGHAGSMSTLHANAPVEALSRLENMIAMGNLPLSASAVQKQIADAVQVVVQTQRLRDGTRRITHITEVRGMDGDHIHTVDLMVLVIEGEGADGRLTGRHVLANPPEVLLDRARDYGLDQDLRAVFAKGGFA
ncbi:CpaF family protein [Elstera cyanobacteriorum]|uniref:CpaF family protein n=1 Tax=Elstera cyanobacteriorum TaxID=2022747 RepID=UPI002353FE8C|nr:CpaF family protein [Elstera cyanobacteriorum]MCK6441603.1 CpaF family protein [Elstera cyanobacteriorum]